MTESVVILDKVGNQSGISGNPLQVSDLANNVVTNFVSSGITDSFGRLRVSNPISRVESQFTYNLAPLTYEQLTNGSGAAIAHNTTERVASLSFTNSPNNSYAYMQSYKHAYYHPGNSHQIFVTTNYKSHREGIIKFAGYGDLSNNGIHLISNGSEPEGQKYAWRLLSNTSHGDTLVYQKDWLIDKLDGTGPSGYVLDVQAPQILVIDLQALYVGLVRVGFDIDGYVVWCHEFKHANRSRYPYIQTATLPLICGMQAQATVTDDMHFICGTVRSEGANLDEEGLGFRAEGTATAGSGAATHILSVRPKQTFNGIVNRINFVLDNLEFVVTGNSSILWDLVVGQAISGTTTFNDVNTNYSGFEYNTAGTISGSPAIIIASGYVAATASNRSSVSKEVVNRYPITLDAAGNVRALGTIGLNVTGLTAGSACRAVMNFREIR